MNIQKYISLVKTVDYRKILNLQTATSLLLIITILAVTLSSIDIILKNYELQKDIAVAEQKVSIAQYEVENQKLQNEFYRTDAYLDIAARKQLTVGLAGEKLMIVPKNVALSYIPNTVSEDTETNETSESKTPFQEWIDFINGRGIRDEEL